MCIRDRESPDLAQVESTLREQNEELTDVDDSIDEFGIDSTTELGVSDDLDDILADVSGGIEQSTDDLDSSINDFVDDDAPISELDDGLTNPADTLDSGLDESIGSIDDPIASIDEPEVEAAPPVVRTTTTSPKPEEKSGLWKIIAGVGALLIAGLGLLFYRRRRADEEFEVSMLSIESNSQTTDASVPVNDSPTLSTTQSTSVASVAENADKETSFLTVYSDSDAVVQADEVDPVAEADVYIAYGRDEQAEEVLLDGVTSHPDRCLLYTSPSPRDLSTSRMPSSA